MALVSHSFLGLLFLQAWLASGLDCCVGQLVECNEDGKWKPGSVKEIAPLKVMLDDSSKNVSCDKRRIVQERFGFRTTQWAQSTFNGPAGYIGTIGEVVAFKSDLVQLNISGQIWNFLPADLVKTCKPFDSKSACAKHGHCRWKWGSCMDIDFQCAAANSTTDEKQPEEQTCHCHGQVKFGYGETWSEWKTVTGEVQCQHGEFGLEKRHGQICICRHVAVLPHLDFKSQLALDIGWFSFTVVSSALCSLSVFRRVNVISGLTLIITILNMAVSFLNIGHAGLSYLSWQYIVLTILVNVQIFAQSQALAGKDTWRSEFCGQLADLLFLPFWYVFPLSFDEREISKHEAFLSRYESDFLVLLSTLKVVMNAFEIMRKRRNETPQNFQPVTTENP